MNKGFTALALAAACSISANATELFTNGGFESGSLTGWTVTSTAGSDDSFTADDTSQTLLNGWATAGPDTGSWYAVSDGSGLVVPETTALTQSVTIPVGTVTDVLSLDMFVNDQFGGSGLGGEVAIWASGVNTVTTAPLFIIFGPTDTTVASFGTGNPYVVLSTDVTGDLTAGTTYQIGVLEQDTSGPIEVGVDNFSLVTTAGTGGVPEPGMLLPTGLRLPQCVQAYCLRCKARAWCRGCLHLV